MATGNNLTAVAAVETNREIFRLINKHDRIAFSIIFSVAKRRPKKKTKILCLFDCCGIMCAEGVNENRACVRVCVSAVAVGAINTIFYRKK